MWLCPELKTEQHAISFPITTNVTDTWTEELKQNPMSLMCVYKYLSTESIMPRCIERYNLLAWTRVYLYFVRFMVVRLTRPSTDSGLRQIGCTFIYVCWKCEEEIYSADCVYPKYLEADGIRICKKFSEILLVGHNLSSWSSCNVYVGIKSCELWCQVIFSWYPWGNTRQNYQYVITCYTIKTDQ